MPPVSDRPPISLRTYRALTRAATPLAPLWLSRRLTQGKESRQRLAERRGEPSVRRPSGPLLWLHSASVGELLAVIPLIERIRARGFGVLLTSGTVTSAELAETRLPAGVIHQFVPLDMPRYADRFFDYWRPNLGMFVESDLWPNLIMASARRGIPLILINGRMSERSFNRWRKAPRTIATLLQSFDLCLAQSSVDADRLLELGAPRINITGNLKLDVPAPPVDPERLKTLRFAIGERPVIAAASTHPGEEQLIAEAHRRLHRSFPGLLTIIAPRHPARGQEIAEIAVGTGLSALQRSQGLLPRRATDIYVADTLGELGLIYNVAPIVFMGGSLVSHGGQNPIEAIRHGAAVLHGPHVWNFAEIYRALDSARGAETVTDVGKLTVRLGALLKDAAARKAVTEQAAKAIDGMAGALGRTLGELEPYLLQFRIEVRSGDA